MLDLNATRNVAEITMLGDTHELYYRTPTTDEMVGFQAEGLVRKGKKIVNRMVAARVKYGALVLIGFKPGTIGFDGEAISSDPKDKKTFRKDWKELLVKAAPQMVGAVGQLAFEGVHLGKGDEGFEFVTDADADLDDSGQAPGSKAHSGSEGSDEAPLAKG
jgi:hypothetical protein